MQKPYSPPNTAPQPSSWVDRSNNEHANRPVMPLLLADTNALIGLSDLDRQLPLSNGRSFFGILDGMIQPGKATLMFPRSVYNESTNWDSVLIPEGNPKAPPKERLKGYLDFTYDEDGELDICINPSLLNHDDNRHFATWLKSKDDQNELRLYDSLESCFNAHEPSKAEGGVVILDTGLIGPRPIYSNGQICDKIRDYTKGNAPPERMLPESESGIGKGDMEFSAMGRCLSSYANQHQTAPRCLFLTDDKECKTNFLNRASVYKDAPPIHADLAHFIAALTQQGLLSKDEYKAALNIAQKDIPQAARPSAARILNSPETAAITGWLNKCGISSPSRSL